MRKGLSLLACALWASVACADVLYWQVGNEDGSLTAEMQTYAYAKIYASNDGGATVTVLNSFMDSADTTPVSSVYHTEMSDAGGFYANLAADYAGYSFAIELYDASETVLGHAGWTAASADAVSSAIISQSAFNSNWQTMTSSGFGSSGWSAGAVAAPEPTSGLLMLLGAALLGLRRRKMA